MLTEVQLAEMIVGPMSGLIFMLADLTVIFIILHLHLDATSMPQVSPIQYTGSPEAPESVQIKVMLLHICPSSACARPLLISVIHARASQITMTKRKNQTAHLQTLLYAQSADLLHE